jgi:endonuclease/exonuclease/phosphatase family metal-dependent hydrolase
MPVLVVGDFNSTPHQWAYRHLAQGLQRVGSRDATFPADRPVVRIDHILAGPAWEVVDARVPVPRQDTAISDHRPVTAQLRWRD